jgi:DNA modification methylase
MGDGMDDGACRLIEGDCRDWLPGIESGTVDAVICDPPYPCIKRSYGTLTEAEWHEMMRVVVGECRRILKPAGSVVFVLQPNSRKMGSMRLWLWEFLIETARGWNLIQDVYWWNTTALPKCGQVRSRVLPRPSVKPCLWFGPADCYRDIDAVLKEVSERVRSSDPDSEPISRPPSGWRDDTRPRFHRRPQMFRKAIERGGTTPFNCLPIPNATSNGSAGDFGHGAGTPRDLMDWWVRYISPVGGLVCDPFVGSGTTALAALKRGRSFIGGDKMPEYVATARNRVEAARSATPLFARSPAGAP